MAMCSFRWDTWITSEPGKVRVLDCRGCAALIRVLDRTGELQITGGAVSIDPDDAMALGVLLTQYAIARTGGVPAPDALRIAYDKVQAAESKTAVRETGDTKGAA